MATVTLLETARQRRLNALGSLGTAKRDRYKDNIVSIFDFAFDESDEEAKVATNNNVVSFHSSRTRIVAANDIAVPERAAA